jgi:hypothetical protein
MLPARKRVAGAACSPYPAKNTIKSSKLLHTTHMVTIHAKPEHTPCQSIPHITHGRISIPRRPQPQRYHQSLNPPADLTYTSPSLITCNNQSHISCRKRDRASLHPIMAHTTVTRLILYNIITRCEKYKSHTPQIQGYTHDTTYIMYHEAVKGNIQ